MIGKITFMWRIERLTGAGDAKFYPGFVEFQRHGKRQIVRLPSSQGEFVGAFNNHRDIPFF
jgi:hypothetical protein